MNKSDPVKQADMVLRHYNPSEGDLETNAMDLLIDLMHWCKHNNVSWEGRLNAAYGRFRDEDRITITKTTSSIERYMDVINIKEG